MGEPIKSFIINSLPQKRSDALSFDSASYYTGKPCKRGHIEPRMTSSARCRKCHAEDCAKSSRTPNGVIQHRERTRRFSKTLKGRLGSRQKSLKRRAVRRNALPQWADLGRINEFIAGCPPGFDVDHILPLAGKNVCGLHVLENLQYLPAKENLSKSNKADPLTLDHVVCVLPGFRKYLHT